MDVRIRNNAQHPATHDLLVNGKLEVEAESWQVVHNIAYSLENHELSKLAWVDECDEIAGRILARIL